jgi:hypothetical protein
VAFTKVLIMYQQEKKEGRKEGKEGRKNKKKILILKLM